MRGPDRRVHEAFASARNDGDELPASTKAFALAVDPISAAAIEGAALADTLALANRLIARMVRR